MYQNQYRGIDERLVRIVQIKCRRLIGRYGIREADLEDICQQWISHAICSDEYRRRQHPRFETHIGRVINRLLIAEIRRRKREKRDWRVACSLDDYVDISEGDRTWGESISEADYLDAFGNPVIDIRELVANRQDLNAFVAVLPSDLRGLALFLQDNPIERYSKVSGVSRATAFRRLKELRKAAAAFFYESF